MISLFVLLLGAVVLAIQFRHARSCLKHLVYQNELDRELAEPDQIVTLSSSVRNLGNVPAFYVNLLEALPATARLEEDERWRRLHLQQVLSEPCCTSKLFLLPHRRYTRQVRFSLPDRGSYSFGKYYVAVGDFLGFRTQCKSGEIGRKIVVMPRRWEHPGLALTLGGYLGDISVRRFLFEDPVLTIGVRDYTGSEPMKQISWKHSARSGSLMVKNFDYTVDANVTVLLNLDGGSAADRECCFRITRSVCEILERRHIPYEFYGNGDLRSPQGELNWLAEGLGSRHFRALMYALGQSKGRSLFSFPRMVENCMKKRRRSRGYIVVSPPLRQEDREALRALRRAAETEPCLLIGAAEEGGSAS